jgi:hypothetical protein
VHNLSINAKYDILSIYLTGAELLMSDRQILIRRSRQFKEARRASM